MGGNVSNGKDVVDSGRIDLFFHIEEARRELTPDERDGWNQSVAVPQKLIVIEIPDQFFSGQSWER